MNKLHKNLALFLICCLQWATAQEFVVQSQFYGIEDGLSHRDVQCIHQDQSGIMWFGTKYGLNRFDGYRFKWYTKETHGFQSNRVNHLLEDFKGRFWLFDTDGYFLKKVHSIDIFDPISEISITFDQFFNNQAPFLAEDVVSFNRNEKGHMVFLTKDNRITIYDGQFRGFPIQLESNNWLFDIHWSVNDLLWLEYKLPLSEGKAKGLVVRAYDLEGNPVHRFRHDVENDYSRIIDFDENGMCRYILSKNSFGDTPGSKLMVGANEISANTHTNQQEYYPELLKNQAFGPASLLKQQDQNIYALFDGKVHVFDVFKKNEEEQLITTLDITDATDLYTDSNGLIWVSSQFGLYQVKIKKNQFKRILHKQEGDLSAIRNICLDNFNKLWFVDEGWANLCVADFNKDTLYTVNESHVIQNNLIFGSILVTVYKGKNGQLYYASSNRLTRFDPQTLEYEYHLIAGPDRKWGFIWTIYEDNSGRIWFTSDQGDIGNLDKEQVNWFPKLDSIKPPNYIYHILEEDNGKAWLATDAGLFAFDLNKGEVLKRYWFGGIDNYYFPFDNIYHIHKDKEGTFWLGTGGSGLIRWSNKGQKSEYTQYSRAHGLNNVIYAVYEDDNDNFWLPSDNGIIRFNKKSGQIKTYLEEDGITHHEFNRISHFQADDGRLFFGGLNGVTAFHPRDFTGDTSSIHAPLVITDYQQFDSEGKHLDQKEKVLMEEHSIVLQPNDRFFRLEFALLTYQDIEKNLYAYKVEGEDQDWTYQKENFIRFSRLPYGNHILKIKGQGSNGQWSKNELSIRVSVLKPFYLQAWFLIATALSIFVLGFLFYRQRTNQLKKRAELLEKEVDNRTKTIRQQAEELKSLEQLKSRFFSNVSHELRTPLSLMSGPVNKVMKSLSPDDQNFKLLQFVQRSTKQLLKLVNEILDLSKLEDNKLEVNEEPVYFFNYMTEQMAQFSSFATSDRINFEMKYELEKELYLLLDKGKFEKILHNYLSNAIKFTPPKGSVDLIVKNQNEDLLIKIKDSGRGIHPEDLPHVFDRFYQSKQKDVKTEGGTGIGLSLCKELAELLGGKVWAESELGKGSIFFYQFPKKVVSGSDFELSNSEVLPTSNVKPQSLTPELQTSKTVNNGQAQSDNTKQTTSKTSTLLIVEDNPDLRDYLSLLLSDYNVLTAEHGQVAWENLNNGGFRDQSQSSNSTISYTHPPDLIISDLMMPVMDGFELLEKIKSDDRFRHLPVIMLTAKANIHSKLHALRVGVDDYMLKPFEEEELLTRVKNLLSNYKERQNLALITENENSPSLGDKTARISKADAEWLQIAEGVFYDYLTDSRLNMDFAATQLNLSRRQFHRKLKQLTGLAPNQYLKEIRLKQAYDLLQSGKTKSVKEACYKVGFNDVRYFSTLFRERFGANPSTINK